MNEIDDINEINVINQPLPRLNRLNIDILIQIGKMALGPNMWLAVAALVASIVMLFVYLYLLMCYDEDDKLLQISQACEKELSDTLRETESLLPGGGDGDGGLRGGRYGCGDGGGGRLSSGGGGALGLGECGDGFGSEGYGGSG